MAPRKIRLGAHVSVAGGISLAVERAQELDAGALQVFVKSARRWQAPPIPEAEARAFRSRARAADLDGHALAHACYLINLASPDATVRRRSRAALVDELARCASVGIPHLVLHPGSPLESGVEAGIRRIADGLDRVLALAPGDTRVLLEVTAGQGNQLGHRFEHVGAILDGMRRHQRVGCCFDTCHALAAGYEFRDRKSFLETFRRFDRAVGLDRLQAFHLNDSQHGIGSRRDRHEHIGRGEVGLEAFRLLLKDRRFRDVPMVLETPKGPEGLADRTNLAVLRWMVEGGKAR